jgi:hypothetical protein
MGVKTSLYISLKENKLISPIFPCHANHFKSIYVILNSYEIALHILMGYQESLLCSGIIQFI